MIEKTNNQKSILEKEGEILKTEEEILREIKKEEGMIRRLAQNVWALTITVSILIVGGAAVLLYWKISGSRIYTDKASVAAPIINLAPQTSGILGSTFVRRGDQIPANTIVAQIGNELIKTKVGGIITAVKDDSGKLFNQGETVVSMIDPGELRVTGRIEEDKGLSDIHIGQKAIFTLDAFSSKEYGGIVDEISPTSREGDIVFNISDKREIKEFDVKIRFDIDKYPEIKNGMSAKLWIYKQ